MKKILVIDNEPNIGLLLENLLQENYEVTYFDSPVVAQDWLETNLPDLIICDIQMPEQNGIELLKNIRSRGYTSHTPVIMLSAKTDSSDKIKCYRLGAQDYVTKPFNPEELEEIIKKNLNPIYYSTSW